MSGQTCSARVWSGWGYYGCTKSAKYEHEGKHFCKTHHPPSMQAKKEARDKAFSDEYERRQLNEKLASDARKETQRRADLFPVLLAALERLMGGTSTMQDAAEAEEQARSAISQANGSRAMTDDEKYLRDLLARIEAFERDKETQRARNHAHTQNERRKYKADAEPITAFSQLEQLK